MTQKTTRIFGPPGTGKTTTLIGIVEESLKKGIEPERIAYLSFSKKASEEAINRACKKLRIAKDRFIYFRTLHSLGHYTQGLKMDNAMEQSDYIQIANALNVEISKYFDKEDEENPYGIKEADNCMTIHHLARSKMIDPKEQWRMAEMHVSVRWDIVKQWIDSVNKYKAQERKHDFEDMLEGFSGALPVDIFIIDEAQDLSNLQWHVVDQACKEASEIYMAGDDDQSIYGWNGANVDKFLGHKVDFDKVLPKSYRVPDGLLDIANRIANRITKRKNKEWQPVGKGGKVHNDVDVWELPIEEGEWFLLARNKKFLKEFEEMLQDKGVLYKNNMYKGGKNSIDKKDARMITNWVRLQKGHPVSLGGANEIIKKINMKAPLIAVDDPKMDDLPFVKSFKEKPWYEVFEKSMRPKTVDYIRNCLRNGQKLNEEPRITISTIHRVKGGEADNVAILPDYSYLSYEYVDGDDEHRLQYVGVTRAKNNLYLLTPITERFYVY